VIGVVLAALSGLCYGASDFSGALGAKRTSAVVIAVCAQIISLVALFALLLVVPPDARYASDFVWAGLGGVGVAVGLTCFYRALAIGPMSTAAAVTSLVGAIVPIATGLGLGERPGGVAIAGMALAVPAVVLVSAGAPGARVASASLPRELVLASRAPRGRASIPTPRERVGATAGGSGASLTLTLAVVGGLGFGLFFVALSRTHEDSGLLPLVGARASSIASIAAVLTVTRTWERVDRSVWPAVGIAGVLDCAANALYVTALDHGELSWVAAISSLYPVSTVLLARVVLGERLGPLQTVGLALAAAAMALVAWGR
jgi:drug/metabolite transporter (DMT)-like permease